MSPYLRMRDVTRHRWSPASASVVVRGLVSDSEEHSNDLGQLEDLYDQGLLTDDEHQDALRRVSSRSDGGAGHDDVEASRRRMPRLFAFWPVLALLVGVGLIIFAIIGTSSGGGGGTT